VKVGKYGSWIGSSASCPESEDSAGGLAALRTSSAFVPSPSDPGPGEEPTSAAASAGSQGYTPSANASVPSIPVVSSGPGWYLYTGDGNPVPVHLAGTPGSGWATSPAPAEIHTTPAIIDGTNYAYGTIMVGDGQVPAPYGSYAGENYPGWAWNNQAVQLSWANLNNKNTVIEDVVAQTGGYIRVLRGDSGAYAPTCLSFVFPSNYTPQVLQLNSANDWVPVKACE
jgi:hypothetical protein